MHICFATMGFTVEYVIFASANTENVEGLALSRRLTATKYMMYNISLTSVNRFIKYDWRRKSVLVLCGCQLPASCLVVVQQCQC